tara:strand:+ start:768 stop:956 length:189 start_codon:yes stop_codon:yes gene_type:complete
MQVLAVRGTEEGSDWLPRIHLRGLDLVINFVSLDMFFFPSKEFSSGHHNAILAFELDVHNKG